MQTMPISPASCASDPHSRTDNEQSDDGELAVSSTVTAMEIEEAMLEEDREEDTDQDELMSSEEFSPLTFQVRKLHHNSKYLAPPVSIQGGKTIVFNGEYLSLFLIVLRKQVITL